MSAMSHAVPTPPVTHSSGVRDVLSVTMMTLTAISWLVSCLVMNCMQLTAFLTLRPLSRSVYRQVNYLITYCMWSPLVALAEHGAGFRVRLFFHDEESLRHFGEEHMIAIANHSFEVDWLFLWLTIDKFHMLASAKAMVKRVIRFFPVMGWAYKFNEFIFLARDWSSDRATLRSGIDNFLTFDRKTLPPVTVLMFCEGTRLTAEKFAAAADFAQRKGILPFKHHLIPRSRGFVCCIQHLKAVDTQEPQRMPAIYNIQIAFSASSEPNFLSLMRAQPVLGDVYVQRIPVSDIPDGGEEEFLMQLYRKKDQLMDEHKAEGQFTAPLCVQPEPRLLPLVNLILWCGSAAIAFVSLLIHSLVNGHTVTLTILSTLLLLTSAGFTFLIRSTRSNHGSSYGASSDSSSAANKKTH